METTLSHPTTTALKPVSAATFQTDRLSPWERRQSAAVPANCLRSRYGSSRRISISYRTFNLEGVEVANGSYVFDGLRLVTAPESAPPQPKTRTTAEKVDHIKCSLGFSTKHLAEACQCSRPTIYAWRDGSQQPQQAQRERIDQLTEIADEWERLSEHCLGASLHEKRSNGIALIDLLKAPQLDRASISAEIQAWAEKVNEYKGMLARKSAETRASFAARGIGPLSKEQIDSNYRAFSMRSTND